MKQVLQNMRNGETRVNEVPIPLARERTALVRTAVSLLSAGTERNIVSFAEKNLAEKARSRPDLVRQAIDKAKREGILTTFESVINRLDQPLSLGYSSAGTVVEIGPGLKGFKAGDRVVCTGGNHAVHAEFAVIPQNLLARLPDSVDFESGAFGAIGAIALNGIHLAHLQVGSKVAVIGLGLLGCLTSQIVKASGCDVTGMDIDPHRVEFAKGIEINAYTNDNVAQNYISFTRGRGFDAVLICADTPTDDTVHLAGVIARDRAYVISLGVVGLNLPRKLYYEKELHFQVSRSSGPGRYDNNYEEEGQDYPIGYVRWTEGRNLEAFIDLLAGKRINVKPLITHRYSINQAENAYDLITGKTGEPYMGVVVTYPHKIPLPKTRKIYSPAQSTPNFQADRLSLGVIGSGNYANAVFLPMIKKNGGVALAGIASANGVNAQHSASRYGFTYSSSSQQEILDDKTIDLVAVLTRHNQHARAIVDGLKKGKHIFCEKPLAIKKNEIAIIDSALKRANHPYLTVGYNRRFSRFGQMVKSFYGKINEPIFASYRINASYLPPDHWLHDLDQGGGRLVGEGCHFIDFLCYLIGGIPSRVRAVSLPDIGKYNKDNFHITMEFPDGSIGAITYLANGNKRYSKEYLEVFGAGKIASLDDFRRLSLIDEKTSIQKKTFLTQDKGHQTLWSEFIQSIKTNKSEPIPYEDLIQISYVILACQHALAAGEVIDIADFIQSV